MLHCYTYLVVLIVGVYVLFLIFWCGRRYQINIYKVTYWFTSFLCVKVCVYVYIPGSLSILCGAAKPLGQLVVTIPCETTFACVWDDLCLARQTLQSVRRTLSLNTVQFSLLYGGVWWADVEDTPCREPTLFLAHRRPSCSHSLANGQTWRHRWI